MLSPAEIAASLTPEEKQTLRRVVAFTWVSDGATASLCARGLTFTRGIWHSSTLLGRTVAAGLSETDD